MTVTFLVVPIILVIAVGYLAKRLDAVPRENWTGMEQLSFKVLIPAIIINSIYRSNLSLSQVGSFIWALLATVSLAGILVLAFRILVPIAKLPNPQLTTLFQATTRWNAFIALALALEAMGQHGLTLVSIAMAFIVPYINVINIVVLAAYGGASFSIRRVLFNIVTNPLVVACAVGLSLNLSGTVVPQPIASALTTISHAALGIGLLAIGASIDFRKLIGISAPLVAGIILRLVVNPLLFLFVAWFLKLDSTQITCGVLICGVPAASNGYIVAKQMGGDAELYAHLLMWQTLLAAVSIAFLLGLVH